MVTQIVAPVAVVVACVAIYMVNIPSLQAAGDMIKGFQAQDPSKRLQEFKTALSRGSFANQEIREQTVRLTQEISSQVPNLAQQMRAANPKLSEKEANDAVQKLRMEYVTLADTAMKAQLEETPNDVRILVFQASFYRVIGDPAKALEVLERAKTLSPEKQQIYFELGLAALDTGDKAKAEEAFKTAYDLEPKFSQARLYYAMSAIYAGDLARAQEIVGPEYQNDYVRSDAIVRALLETKQYGEMENIYKARIEQNPNDIQLRVSLAWIQNTAGRKADAIATIRAATEKFPDFKTQGERYIKDLESAATPQ